MSALRLPTRYKVVQWREPNDKSKAKAGLVFPKMDKAAAFICAGTRCSRPVFEASGMNEALKGLGYPMELDR